MKKILAISAVLSMLAVPVLAAPDHNKGQSDNRGRQEQGRSQQDSHSKKQDSHSQRQDSHSQKSNNSRAHKRQYSYDGKRYDSYRTNAWKAPRGHDAKRQWRKGDKLPKAYRDRAYVVNYRAYNLGRPPYGYEWVRVSNSAFLVRQSNGLVSDLVSNLFY
tara:strand:+ start:3662 stop:4141 length:480 start_codon:yes stop_codon:yes gene_type:complete